MEPGEGRSSWTKARVREAAAGGQAAQDLLDLLERTARRECRSLMPADRDRIRGRILLRLWAESGRRILGLRDPAQLPRYVIMLVRRERALYKRKTRRICLQDPLVLALHTARLAGDAGHEVEPSPAEGLREWIETALLVCTKLQTRVVLAYLQHESWAKVAAAVGGTKGAARQAFLRAVDRIRAAVESGRVHPPPLIC